MGSNDIYDYLTNIGVLKKEKDIVTKRNQKKIETERDKKIQNARYLSKNKKKTEVRVIKENDSVLSESDDSDDNTFVTDSQIRKKMDNNRLKELLNDIDYTNNKQFVNNLFTNYSNELEDYIHINGNNIDKMKLGGYVRYFTFDGELKFGGILIKIQDNKLNKMLLFLKNSSNAVWKIRYKNFHIFYKNNVTSADKFRKLFLTASDLNNF